MTSKAERKRRAKNRQITLAGGESVAQRATGRDRRHTNTPEDATRVAFEARARRLGMVGAKDQDSACRSPLAGCDVGLCLLSIHPASAAHGPLWEVWGAITSARANYRIRILGTSGNPQGAAIAMVPEPMQTDQSHSVDIRTAEERDISARRAMAYWDGLLSKLPAPQLKWALRAALDEGAGALWRDGKPTARGQTAVQALEMLNVMREASNRM